MTQTALPRRSPGRGPAHDVVELGTRRTRLTMKISGHNGHYGHRYEPVRVIHPEFESFRDWPGVGFPFPRFHSAGTIV